MTTTDQAHSALHKANDVRIGQTRLRAQIRNAGRADGAALAAQVVLDSSTSMRFEKLLRAIPRVGRIRTEEMLVEAHINPTYRVDSWLVDSRRRKVLAQKLQEMS